MARMTKAQKQAAALKDMSLPPPIVETRKLDDIPDPRRSIEHVRLNDARPVVQAEGETLSEAVFRDWEIQKHMNILSTCVQGELEDNLVIELARDTETGEEKHIEGNRSTVTLKCLKALHPNGHKVERKVNDKLTVSFDKSYDGPFKVKVYEDLTPEQFKYAQGRNVAARVNPRAFGAWTRLVGLLAAGYSESEAEASMGQLMYSINPNHDPKGTWRPTVQAAGRIAKLPEDLRREALNVKGRIDGETRPNDKDMRKLLPLLETDINAFNKAQVMEPGFDKQVKSLADYKRLIGETDFTREWEAARALSGSTAPKGTAALSGTKLAELAEKVKDSPVLKGVINHVRGMVGYTGKAVQEALTAYQSASDECFRTTKPELHAQLKQRIADAMVAAQAPVVEALAEESDSDE